MIEKNYRIRREKVERILLFFLMAFVPLLALQAQTLTVNAPSHVQNGENFRVTYTVNTQNVDDF